jgi:hypothetical protein
MCDWKLYVKTSHTEPAKTASSPSLAPRSDVSVCEPEEGLRLVRAFLQITDSSRRAWLIAEAEKIARR